MDSLSVFQHGVASGDPNQESVIIWTRVTTEAENDLILVHWQVSKDQTFGSLVQEGYVYTGAQRDFTVKVDVGSLASGQTYFYRFQYEDNISPVGRTHTLADETDHARFAVVSCSNYEWGFFNAYECLSREDSITAVLHLGDYIYEHGPGTYGDTTLGRLHEPPYEIVSLADYRTRYAQYRSDTNLQAVHAAHPFISVWDDHEITNNAYVDGAQNHQEEEEGDYLLRRENARRAYYEWLPIRESSTHYRHFTLSPLAELYMLDERLAGRTAPAEKLTFPLEVDEGHTLLGEEQWQWLERSLEKQRSTWTLFGNQVIYSYLNWGHESFNINLDSWDGYPSDQKRMEQLLESHDVQNPLFLTGDTHSSWVLECVHLPLDQYDPATSKGAHAVEFGTPSISSSNSNERFDNEEVIKHEKKITRTEVNPHLLFSNLRDHGYLIIDVIPDKTTIQYKYVSTVKAVDHQISHSKTFEVLKGTHRATEVRK